MSHSRGRRTRGSFQITYLHRELQHRWHQTVIAALGLAVGIGFVITVTAAAGGVSDAEAEVLHSLYGIGTDVSVTKAPSRASSGSNQGILTPGATEQHLNLLRVSTGLALLDQSSVERIARLKYVAAAAGGLTMTDWEVDLPSAAQVGQTGKLSAGTSFTVDGVDLAHLDLGPFSSARVVTGRTFRASDAAADVAIVDAGYAASHGISVGSTFKIAGVDFRVIGLIDQPQGAGASDTYIPLGRAQALAQFHGAAVGHQVSDIYVSAVSDSHVGAVQAEISRLLPGATATTSGNLAGKVSGSLSSAAKLASDLGRWLAVAALIAAFTVAGLLSSAAVTRRVPELGTLKAIGWRTNRIVSQIVAESATVSLPGAVLGIAIGFGGSALIDLLARDLSATVASSPGATPAQGATVSGGVLHHSTLPGAVSTVPVHLHAAVQPSAIAVAVGLALAGGLIAGAFGAWRATRLTPRDALTHLE